MKDVIEKIEEMCSMLERDIEWPMTDHVEKKDIQPMLTEIYSCLMVLKLKAEDIEEML